MKSESIRTTGTNADNVCKYNFDENARIIFKKISSLT